MSNKLRSLRFEIDADIKKAQSNLNTLSRELNTAGKNAQKLGTSLTNNITKPALAVAAALGGIVIKASGAADELSQMSAVTGLSTDRLQELQYVGTKLDVELESLTGTQRFLTNAMNAALKPTTEQAAVFKKLGVNVTDSNGRLRNSNEVLFEVITALHNMDNETERNAATLKLFGRSALELNPLIEASGDEIARLTKEAHTSGAVMSAETVQALDEFNDSMEATKQVVMASGAKIAMALLPSLKELAATIARDGVPLLQNLADTISKVVKWFSSLPESTQKFIGTLGLVSVAAGPALKTFGGIERGMGTMVKSFSKALPGITKGIASLTTSLGGAVPKTLSFGGAIKGLFAAAPALGPVLLGVAGAAVVMGAAFGPAISDQQKFAAAADKVRKGMEDAETTYKKTTASIAANVTEAQSLTKQLNDLNQKTAKTDADYAQMDSLVTRLNSLVPDLNLAFDDQTGTLNLTNDQLQGMIANYAKLAEVEAKHQKLIDLTNSKLDAQQTLNDRISKYVGDVSGMTPQQVYDKVYGSEWFAGKGTIERGAIMRLISDLATTQTKIDKLANPNAPGVEDPTIEWFKKGVEDSTGEVKDMGRSAGNASYAVEDFAERLRQTKIVMPGETAGNASGLSYVPRTMNTIVHTGEEIISAGNRRSPDESGGSLAASFQIPVIVQLDGRTVHESTIKQQKIYNIMKGTAYAT